MDLELTHAASLVGEDAAHGAHPDAGPVQIKAHIASYTAAIDALLQAAWDAGFAEAANLAQQAHLLTTQPR